MIVMEIFEDIVQGSTEWYALRRGIPTASVFKVLMVKTAEKKGRTTLLHRLAGERLTGESAETYTNDAMEDGKAKEPILREDYAFLRNCEPKVVGFIRNGKCGGSPDALIGDDGILEIKRAQPTVLIPLRIKAKEESTKFFPGEHYAQCQGNLMVSGRKWCDLLVGYPKMKPVIVRTERNESYIADLNDEIDRFDLELRRLVEWLK